MLLGPRRESIIAVAVHQQLQASAAVGATRRARVVVRAQLCSPAAPRDSPPSACRPQLWRSRRAGSQRGVSPGNLLGRPPGLCRPISGLGGQGSCPNSTGAHPRVARIVLGAAPSSAPPPRRLPGQQCAAPHCAGAAAPRLACCHTGGLLSPALWQQLGPIIHLFMGRCTRVQNEPTCRHSWMRPQDSGLIDGGSQTTIHN